MITEQRARRTADRVSKQVANAVIEKFAEPDSQMFMWPSEAELPAWLDAILDQQDREDCDKWRILTYDAITGHLHQGTSVLTKQEALAHFEIWNSQKQQAIAVPWPAWAYLPKISVPEAENEQVAEPTKKRKSDWGVITIDLETGKVDQRERGFTKAAAFASCRQWKAKRQQAVCIPWPEWAPKPVIRVPLGG